MPKSTKKIYLDYAASVSPNPSSIHELGILAKQKLETARAITAETLQARPVEIIFTSGGTEGNNLAIQGTVFAAPFFPHIITTNIEHPSVLETCKLLEKRKLAQISIVPVEANGIVDSKKIRQAIRKNTILVSVMYANNEIGTIQPIKEIAREIRHYKKIHKRNNLYFHTDAVQGANYLDLSVEKLGVDMLTLSGSKIENAGKIGVLYKRKNVLLAGVFGGGDQEFGLRPGTENLPEILKFVQAFGVARKIKDKETKRLTKLRDYFIIKLSRMPLDMKVNGDQKNRLPNNVNITFPKIPSDLLVLELSAWGVMCSSKSACKSSRVDGSYVIKALRPNADPEIGGVRFSLGPDTTKKDVDYTIKALAQILTKLKKWYTHTPI